MKDVRICVVVTGKNREEFLDNLEKIQRVADLVELRVDYIEGFSINDIDLIKNKIYRKAIFTCRKKEEGGFYNGSEQERAAILKKAMGLGFEYVDIELAAVVNFQSNNTDLNNRSKIILSYHNFNNTPAISELEVIKKEMKRYSPDIMKYATLVRDARDIKTLFTFLLDKQAGEEMIVVGMGGKGRMSRVVAPLLGSYLTYASTDYSESATGQIGINELKKLYNDLGVFYGGE